jgi:hypothetical protein
MKAGRIEQLLQIFVSSDLRQHNYEKDISDQFGTYDDVSSYVAGNGTKETK